MSQLRTLPDSFKDNLWVGSNVCFVFTGPCMFPHLDVQLSPRGIVNAVLAEPSIHSPKLSSSPWSISKLIKKYGAGEPHEILIYCSLSPCAIQIALSLC